MDRIPRTTTRIKTRTTTRSERILKLRKRSESLKLEGSWLS